VTIAAPASRVAPRTGDALAAAPSTTQPTIPAERLYWSVLDAPRGARLRPGPLPIGLRIAFEEDVPIPENIAGDEAGAMHIVCTPLPGGRILACGGPIAELTAALPPLATALIPASLPAFIHDELVADPAADRAADPASLAASLNLLVGELEPAHIRAARARRRTVVLAASLLAVLLLALGLSRRAASDRLLAADALAAADTAAQDLGRALSLPARITPDTLPAILAVAQRSADAAARIAPPRDASGPLEALLAAWPAPPTFPAVPDLHSNAWTSTVQSLNVTGDTIALILTIDGEAAAFLREFTVPPGWSLDEPRLTTIGRPASGAGDAGTLVRLTLTLRRAAEMEPVR
jgi:hypothetical protein